jgi:hypothetical protein
MHILSNKKETQEGSHSQTFFCDSPPIAIAVAAVWGGLQGVQHT